jgi:hypothetical protein
VRLHLQASPCLLAACLACSAVMLSLTMAKGPVRVIFKVHQNGDFSLQCIIFELELPVCSFHLLCFCGAAIIRTLSQFILQPPSRAFLTCHLLSSNQENTTNTAVCLFGSSRQVFVDRLPPC